VLNLSEHHLVPKSEGGKDKYPVHNICHRKIHATFTERELAREYYTFELLLAHPDVACFVKWVAKKEPGFYDHSFSAKRKK